MYNLWNRIKSGISDIVKSRTFIAIIMFCVLSAVLLQRVFYLQIVKGQNYTDKYELQIQKTKEVEGTRGNIYDRNGVLLAYNELAYSVTIQDNGDYDKKSEKNKALNQIVTKVINIVESNGDSVINDFGIILDANSEYSFVAESDTQRLRFIADVYGKKTIDELSDKQKSQSAADIMHYLCTDKTYGYGINEKKLDKTMILKLVNVRYAMSLNSYQKYISTTIASDVSDQTVADIMENSDSLQGVNIEEESLRRYTDSKCFANVIGYTGQISTDEYDALSKEDQEIYSKTDTVGKSGLEKVLDSTLRGKKGEVKLYVNNVGKVLDTVQSTEPKAGNDVYLSLDANLQKAAYNILEQELAGILLSKIQNTLDFDRNSVSDGSDVMIPIGDVYNALIANDVVNMTHFSENDAKSTEQEVYNTFSGYKEQVLASLSSTLADPNAAAYKDDSKEMQAYLSYIVTDILTNNTGILNSSVIDKNDETYKAWKTDETINVYTFLNYAVSQNWIDTSKLQNYTSNGGKYSDSSETFQAIISYLNEHLKSDNSFDKLIYKYMIKAGSITGRELCMILYEQNILNYDESQYNALASGATTAYDFMRGKIQTLEITPGQLGLEPCTGSFVMTDTSTGQVLACVSYPGYDNNRLANTMDSAYYNQLNTGRANIFYNRATQEKTAPGSTFKMISATAGLEEGYIDAYTTTYCSGSFNTVTPSPKCWIYPGGHGALNVVQSLQHSCNVFYYQLGYNMGIDSNGNYDSDLGTDKLRKYAAMYGLDRKSGVEIPEAAPQISDEYSIQSAIGQGTNNFTVSQLNRYVTAVANSGTVYDLTLIDKTTDAAGNLIKDYSAEVDSTMDEINSSTWDLIHQGMEQMVASSTTFTGLDFSMAGKTGTAQHNELHADHVLFVGYAPAEQPQLSIAVRITYGYNSGYASEIGRDIAKVYFNPETAGELITGSAANLGEGIAGD